jgi:hypothetical protein
MKKAIVSCLLLISCAHGKQYEMRKRECDKVCKPYAVSYVSAKDECVCDLSLLQ